MDDLQGTIPFQKGNEPLPAWFKCQIPSTRSALRPMSDTEMPLTGDSGELEEVQFDIPEDTAGGTTQFVTCNLVGNKKVQ